MKSFKLVIFSLSARAKSEKGQTMVEYALIIVLIAMAAIVAMKYLGGTVNNTYSSAASTLATP